MKCGAKGSLIGLCLNGTSFFASCALRLLLIFTLSYAPLSIAAEPAPPFMGFNPQLDYGVQGSLPRYKPFNTDGSVNTTHVFMPPKNTPALSLVDNFPWLFMYPPPASQKFLYRGTGANLVYDVNTPMRLDSKNYNATDPLANTFNLSASDAGDPVFDSKSNIDELALNESKCIPLEYRDGKCHGIKPLSLLGGLVDADYMSQSPALLNRLKLDSCINQTIIPSGLKSRFVFSDEQRWHDSSFNESWCQPFKMKPAPCIRNRILPITPCLPDSGERDGYLYDYRAWGYLRYAWESVLKDGYTPSGGAGFYYNGDDGIGFPPYLTVKSLLISLGFPLLGLNMPSVLKLKSEVPGDEKYGAPKLLPTDTGNIPTWEIFPGGSHPFYELSPSSITANILNMAPLWSGQLTMINDLAERPYERIWDPTHPYSPRWDFHHTDRYYSHDARVGGYFDKLIPGQGFTTSTSNCIVRCAAVPVDIMSFRSIAFNKCISQRILTNSLVFWKEVMFLNTTVNLPFPFTAYFWRSKCLKESLEDAVNDTARDRVWGTWILLFNPMATAGIALKIPYVRHGRIPVGGESKMAHDRVKVTILNIISFTLPRVLSSGCHFSMDPAIMEYATLVNPLSICGGTGYMPWAEGSVFAKTFLHDLWNPDRCLSKKLPFLRQPQPKSFDSQWPICSTKYDVQDSSVHYIQCLPSDIMSGDINPIHGIRNCCDDVAHALTPLNTLKIRNTIFNPGLKPTPEGYAFQEYFSNRDNTRTDPDPPSVIQAPDPNSPANMVDYVGSHMPYMRWWDTGTAAGGSADWVGIKDYDPDNDCGKYDTLAGIGVEDWDGDYSNAASPPSYVPSDTPSSNWHAAKYCRYGGNGFAVDTDNGLTFTADFLNLLAGAVGIESVSDWVHLDLSKIGIPPFYQCIRLRTIDLGNRQLGPDAMTSWEELKLYQMRALKMGLNCMPKYEKMHKANSPEDFVLKAAGGTIQVPVLVNRSAGDNTAVNDPARGPDKGYYKVPYRGAPSANPAPATYDAATGQTKYNYVGSEGNSIAMKNVRWPLAWRGYVTDLGDSVDGLDSNIPSKAGTACGMSFPNFAGDGTNFLLGLLNMPAFNTFTFPCPADAPGGFGDALASNGWWRLPGVSTPLGNVVGPIWGDADYPNNEVWPLMPGGLGRAQPGDIVYITQEDINYVKAVAYLNWSSGYFASSMPFTAYVESVHNYWTGTDGKRHAPVKDAHICTAGESEPDCCPPNEPTCFTECEASVTIRDANIGKFPDACGNTEMYGHNQQRTIYKEWLPTFVQDVIYPDGVDVYDNCGHAYTTKSAGGATGEYVTDTNSDDDISGGISSTNYGSCADPKMKVCTYADLAFGGSNPDASNMWDHFRIYRPTYDIRQ